MVGRDLEWLGEEEHAEPYEKQWNESANENLDMVGIHYDYDVSKEAEKSRDYREQMEHTWANMLNTYGESMAYTTYGMSFFLKSKLI